MIAHSLKINSKKVNKKIIDETLSNLYWTTHFKSDGHIHLSNDDYKSFLKSIGLADCYPDYIDEHMPIEVYSGPIGKYSIYRDSALLTGNAIFFIKSDFDEIHKSLVENKVMKEKFRSWGIDVKLKDSIIDFFGNLDRLNEVDGNEWCVELVKIINTIAGTRQPQYAYYMVGNEGKEIPKTHIPASIPTNQPIFHESSYAYLNQIVCFHQLTSNDYSIDSVYDFHDINEVEHIARNMIAIKEFLKV